MNDERKPPEKVRLSGLQEAQVAHLIELERQTTAMYHQLGFDAAEVPPRSFTDIARLPRDHEVYVAEADHVVAGYAAWRDESPGVAYVEEIGVLPAYHRFGIGTQLLERIAERAKEVGLHAMVLKAWDKAPFAQAFYRHHGFRPLGDDIEGVPAAVRGWKDERSGGRPLTRPGESILWRAL